MYYVYSNKLGFYLHTIKFGNDLNIALDFGDLETARCILNNLNKLPHLHEADLKIIQVYFP